MQSLGPQPGVRMPGAGVDHNQLHAQPADRRSNPVLPLPAGTDSPVRADSAERLTEGACIA